MSQEPDSSANLSGLEMDLLRSLQPSWVKDTSPAEKFSRLDSHGGSSRREDKFDSDHEDFEQRRQRLMPKKPKRHGQMREGKFPSRGDKQSPGKFGSAPRSQGGGEQRSFGPRERQPRPPREEVLEGWEIRFLAEERGVEGLIKQIKANAKAYALFDLARLVLEKSARYRVGFKRVSGPQLFRVVSDSTLWLTEAEAQSHATAVATETLYRKDRVPVDPPKGEFPAIAQCGMSGVFLGPPNHHDYQLKLRKLHAERFANVPFDVFKSRVRTVRDEESMAKWKEEQSFADVYYPAEAPEGSEPQPLRSLAEVAEHFRKNHASTAVDNPGDEFQTPGSPVVNDSAPLVIGFVRRELDNLLRFPLPMAHTLGQQLAGGGLQIFKANENITYVSVARPRPINREAVPVSPSAAAIFDYLEANAKTPRAKQWQDLLALPRPDGGEDAAQRESALLRDLYWLLHQGHVIDFATKNLQVARRPAPKKPVPEKPESQKVEESGAAAAPAAEVEDSGRDAQATEEVPPAGEMVEVAVAPAAEAQAPSES